MNCLSFGFREVAAALAHFQATRYLLREWVIMPNHVHAVVTPLAGYELSDILHSWKSYSAHQINQQLGRTGQLWQKESFDHILFATRISWPASNGIFTTTHAG